MASSVTTVSVTKLSKNTITYVIYDFMLKGRGVILLPLFTRFLTPQEYGSYVIVTSLTAFLLNFTKVLVQANNRFYFDCNEEGYLKKLWGTNITFTALLAFIIPLFLLMLGKSGFSHIIKDVDFYPLIFLGILLIPPMTLIDIYQGIQQTQQRAFKFAVFGLSMQVVNIILIVLALTVFKMKVPGILLSTLLVNIVGCIYVYIAFVRNLELGIDRQVLKKSFNYSAQFVPHTLSGSIFSFLDRFFLTNIRSTFDTGIYQVGATFGLSLNTITAGFNEAFVPFFMSKVDDEDNHQGITRIASLAVFVYVGIGIGIAMYANDLITLFTTSKYYGASLIVPIFILANIFDGIYRIFVAPLFYNVKGPRYVSLITSIVGGLNIIALYFLITYYGMLGAALTSLIISFIMAVSVGYVSHKVHPIGWDYKKILMIVIGGIMIALAMLKLNEIVEIKYFVLIKIPLYLLSLFVLALIGGYRVKSLRRDLSYFINLIKSKGYFAK